MRLFGEQGYAATSVAEIEAAAGLRPGAGGLYAHFRSKEALLREGLEELLTADPDLMLANRQEAAGEADRQASGGTEPFRLERAGSGSPQADDTGSTPYEDLVAELEGVVRAGLSRLRHDRDYNRILVRDLRRLPDLLEMSADREIRPLHDQLEAFLSSPLLTLPTGAHPRALAAVLIGATSHFWLLSDVFGKYPAGVSEEQYVTTLARVAATVLTQGSKR